MKRNLFIGKTVKGKLRTEKGRKIVAKKQEISRKINERPGSRSRRTAPSRGKRHKPEKAFSKTLHDGKTLEHVKVEFDKQAKYTPIIMVPRPHPSTGVPGPFTQIVVTANALPYVEERIAQGPEGKPVTYKIRKRRPFPTVWVRVTRGDDLNGEGFVMQSSPRAPGLHERTHVRFGGGTRESWPKLLETISDLSGRRPAATV